MSYIQKISKSYYQNDLNKLYLKLVGYKYKNFILNPEQKNFEKMKNNFLILDNSIGRVKDIQELFEKFEKSMLPGSKIIITYYNHLWEPILKIATLLGLRKNTGELNWLDNEDIKNLLNIAGFEIITSQRRMLMPVKLGFISDYINMYIAHIPIINSLCLTTYVIAAKKRVKKNKMSVSIIVPARNEEGNIKKIIESIPVFGTFQEIIFVEGGSTDETWNQIQNIRKLNKSKFKNILSFKQKNKGKADAVRLGFSKSKGEILMIYDADRTVDAHDLKKFYRVLESGMGEFVNGSRMVYPMEKDAMRTINKIGNKVFSIIFTWILGQRFRDTLCGTKAFFTNDYKKFHLFKDDPFGDFELIFGAVKNNLKIVEIPVRYKERVYGKTNISRFSHGLLLIKMVFKAYKIFKAW